MRPPYYHTLAAALHLQDRYGLKPENVSQEAESIRRIALDNNQHKEYNRSLWADYILQNPSDRVAQYMRKYVLS